MSKRLYYATDIHGSEVCFLKFLKAAEFYHCDLLIMGGDITGKMLVPLIRAGNGGVRASFNEKKWEASTEEEIEAIETRVRRSGGYPYRCAEDEYQLLIADEAYRDKVFSETMLNETRRLVEIAEERLSKAEIPCFMTPGNDDQLVIDGAFYGTTWLTNPEGEVVSLDENHEMISTGYANMTPWQCPRDETEESLAARIEQMTSKLKRPETAIFNFHCPPYASKLDDAPELDETLRPVMRGGQQHMVPVGSKAVREAIERWQPLVGLHGHIHEAKGSNKIGRTLCFNPGSEYGTGYLRGLILELGDNKIEMSQFTSG